MTVHPVHPADLSAYYDGEMSETEKRGIEAHLSGCAECREILAGYSWIGDALRAGEPDPFPLAVDRRVRSLVRTGGAPGRRPWLAGLPSHRPALAGVALAAILLIVTVMGLPFGGSSGARVASAYLYNDDGRSTIEVRFTGPVDRESVRKSVRLDPPADVSVSWRGDTLVVQPAQPLQPAGHTLSLNTEADSGSGGAAPVTFDLPPAEKAPSAPSTPMALPTKPVPIAVKETSTSTATPTPRGTSTVVASATPEKRVTATASPVPFPVVRGFDLLLRSQPAIAASLGAAREPEHGAQSVMQPFERGWMLSRADRKEILVILNNGRWQSLPDTFDGTEPASPRLGEPARGFGKLWREQPDLRTSLGNPTATEAPVGVVLQQFEKGLLLWTPDRNIYVLLAGGTWDRYADTFQDPTATPAAKTPAATTTPTPVLTATVTPTPTVTSTPTAEPSPTNPPTPSSSPTVTAEPTQPEATRTPTQTPPTATASPTVPPTMGTPVATGTPTPVAQPTAGPIVEGTECKVVPWRGFGLLRTTIPPLAVRLGCAQGAETSVQVVRQTFEHGQMIWRSDTNEILVLPRDAGWSVYRDTYQEGDVLADAGTAPAGMFVPVRGFGKVWRLRPDVRAALGWATMEEQGLSGVVQEFAGGRMLWASDRSIAVLYTGGSWQGFQDGYVP